MLITSKTDIERLWKQQNFKPNNNQREAILHVDGPLFLTAGPGSGKTRVLLWRTLNLLVFHNVKPEEIFLSTFTEKAALQLKEGLQILLSSVKNETNRSFDLSKMFLGTVHSNCQRILLERDFSKERVRRQPPVLRDELAQYLKIYNKRYWKEIVESAEFADEEDAQRSINQYLEGKNIASRHSAVQNVIKVFNRFSEENIDAAKVQTKDPLLKQLLKMYRHYRQSLIISPELQEVDFSLLQQAAYNALLEYPGSSGVFSHVIIDEYQDTNPIQEKIFFQLAAGKKNICVVGDDDQALYRFRGATVENLVEFPQRCKDYLKSSPRRYDLDINYRSRKHIVDIYKHFIDKCDWKKEGGKGYYRVADKVIKANSRDALLSVIVSEKDKAPNVYKEIAAYVKKLKAEGKVQDYNQVAFLFPAMKNSARVTGFLEAFESLGVPVYAPRAGRFLEVNESKAIWGLLLKIFGRPKYDEMSFGLQDFNRWIKDCIEYADQLIESDSLLKEYINDRKQEIETVVGDYEILLKLASRRKWDVKTPALPAMIDEMAKNPSISLRAKKNLNNHFFRKSLQIKQKEKKPFSLEYVLRRVTALDWSILDLFYQLNGFRYFRDMYRLAETGLDEGPVCNLGLITQYLSRFMEEYVAILTAPLLYEDKFVRIFFASYTYALFRLGESEYENAEDPFPKGRVPFLTIHQSKGLEFPVVVMGGLFRKDREASKVEEIIRHISKKEGEPLDRISEFDNMRMFYVGLSRAKNLLVLPRYKGPAAAHDAFRELFADTKFTTIQETNWSAIPEAVLDQEDLGKNYSYTGDYLNYRKCPRQYMVFRKYGFVPSRSQTMFFGNLVHKTIEDLHQLLINERKKTTV